MQLPQIPESKYCVRKGETLEIHPVTQLNVVTQRDMLFLLRQEIIGKNPSLKPLS
jgi:hypothetical protein